MNIRRIVMIGLCVALSGLSAHAADRSICADDADVILYDDGSLQSCSSLGDNYNTNNISCEADFSITFYKNGQLASCVLGEETTVEGVRCKEDSEISFYEDGRLYNCVKAPE